MTYSPANSFTQAFTTNAQTQKNRIDQKTRLLPDLADLEYGDGGFRGRMGNR